MDIIENDILINKSVSRFIAILTLYAADINDQQDLKEVSLQVLQSYFKKDLFDIDESEVIELHQPNKMLLDHLLNTYILNKQDIEKKISDNLNEKYNFNKLDLVIKAILCLATAELLYHQDIPAKIIIDEYVSLSKTFFNNAETGFINKVIDIIAKSIRATDEF